MAKRIPSLDGVRALSIGTVLVSHLAGSGGLPDFWVPPRFGPFGVQIFFIISGYLITSLLLKERARTGDISLRGFYFRRTVRIFPAMYVFFAGVLLLEALGVVALGPGDALAAATYTMNFHGERAWWLGHCWSLSVEEQFYLLWPAAVAFLGVAGGLRVALGAMVAAPFLRVGAFYAWPSLRPLLDQAFPFVFDALATGCVLAILRDQLWASPRYRAIIESRWFFLVPIASVAFYNGTPKIGLFLLAGQTLANLGIAMSVDWAMRHPDGVVGRVLNWGPMVWFGQLAYSLYLWQQVFLGTGYPAWFRTFPLNLALAVGVAAASFYLVEKPLMDAREKWSRQRAARVAPVAAVGAESDGST